jgi:hypothetical protein
MIFPIFVYLALLAIQFVPIEKAYRRKHKSRQAITILTICGGWTVIGWVIALVWAYSNAVESYGYQIDKAEKSWLRWTMVKAVVVYLIIGFILLSGIR